MSVRLLAEGRVSRVLAVAWVLSAWGWGLGCSPAAAPVAASAPQTPVQARAPLPPPPLVPLTGEEELLRQEVQGGVGELAELGPRSLAHSWNLHSATDYLARKLETYGYEVMRQGFPVADEVLQNLEVVVPGTKTGEQVLIAAHYDTDAESPGANASASGAAVLLSLAKELRGKQPARSVRLVWLANESGGQGVTGSAVYAKHAQKLGAPVVATLTLGSLGNYSLAFGSQRYPAELLYGDEKRSRFGNFIAVVSNAGSHPLLERVRPTLAAASLPVEELILPDGAPLAAEGPQARFWGAGLLGLVLTDTGVFRSPYPAGPLDTPDKVDFDRLARVRRLVGSLVFQLAGPMEAGSAPPSASPAAG